MKPANRAAPRNVTWLALTLSLGYLALMATLMWLFEHAVTRADLEDLLQSPNRTKSWLIIAVTALVIFLLARWALLRFSSPDALAADSSPDAAAVSDRPGSSAKFWRDVLLFMSLVAAVLAGTGSYVVAEQEKTLDAARYRHFTLIGRMKAQSVARWVDERQADMRTLLGNTDFGAGLARWNAAAGTSAGSALRASLLADLEAVRAANGYDGIAVVSRTGETTLSAPDDLPIRSMCRQAATAANVAAEAPISLSFAFSGAEAQPGLDVIGRLSVPHGDDGRPLATLCMRVDLTRRLLPMVSQWPGVARSGEVLLGRPDGDDIVLLNGAGASTPGWRLQRLAGAAADWAAALQATRDQRRISRADHAQGAKLISGHAVPSTPWLLMVRMDADEADQLQSRGQTYGTIAIGFVLIFIVASFAVAWARSSAGSERFHAQRDRLLEQLSELAFNDELTGLPRRRLIEDRLAVAIRDADRRSEHVGILFIDLDKFKSINDEHGHAAGDFLLQAIATRLRSALRKNDSAGRLSGDEFLVVLPGNMAPAGLTLMRDKLAQTLQAPVAWQGRTLQVGVSIGLAIYPDDGATVPALIAQADKAMYRDKGLSG